MYPVDFEYHDPASVEAAIDLLRAHDDERTELLAGGHSLVPAMKAGRATPDVVVDIADIDELRGIHRDGDTLVVGALTRYSDLLDADSMREHAPAVVPAVEAIGGRQTRNRGTVGGNLAQADPTADLPAAVLASDATMVVRGPDGERAVSAERFFRGRHATAIGSEELLVRVEMPVAPDAVGTYLKRASPSGGYALVGVSVLLTADSGTVRTVRVAVNGVRDHAVRLGDVESTLVGERLDADRIEAAATEATTAVGVDRVRDDREVSAAFRRRLLEVYTRRALEDAAERVAAP